MQNRKISGFNLRGQRGTSLVDVMFATFLLALAGVVFAATFPTGISYSRRAKEMKVATAIAQKKIEQLRSVNYESLTQPLLYTAGIIDNTTAYGGYAFTSVDNVSTQLSNGAGRLIVTDKTADVKQISVTVFWKRDNSSKTDSVTLMTYIADKRSRPVVK